jgi:hypothetical protein
MLTQLLHWIGEIEDKVAYQDVVNEDIQKLRNQINNLQVRLLYFYYINIVEHKIMRY